MFTPLTEEQARVYIDTCQLYSALQNAMAQAAHYKGSMRWIKRGDKEYLFKARDRKGNGTSLGPRSAKTEQQRTQFMLGKQQSGDRVKALKEKLLLQAKYNKANRLGRLPVDAAKVLRGMHAMGVEHTVIGTNAMFAYEALAGVQFVREILATTDIDILFDARKALIIACKLEGRSLVKMLKKVDKSFEPVQQGHFRLVNKSGYLVDFVTQAPRSPLLPSPFEALIKGDARPTDGVSKMEWILSSPKLNQVVIAADGLPVVMTTPDPRAFVLHKFFMSNQDSREPVKKQRDLKQAFTVANVIQQHLPQFSFEDEAIRAMPLALRKAFSDQQKPSEDHSFW